MTPVSLEMVGTPDGAAVRRLAARPSAEDDPTGGPHTLLLLADPFTFPAEAFLPGSPTTAPSSR